MSKPNLIKLHKKVARTIQEATTRGTAGIFPEQFELDEFSRRLVEEMEELEARVEALERHNEAILGCLKLITQKLAKPS